MYIVTHPTETFWHKVFWTLLKKVTQTSEKAFGDQLSNVWTLSKYFQFLNNRTNGFQAVSEFSSKTRFNCAWGIYF